MADDRIYRIPRYARRHDTEAQEAERHQRREQEARRSWQEGEADYYGHRDDDRAAHEQAWTHAGRHHPHYGEPRVYGDPFNIEPGYPRASRGYAPRHDERDEERGLIAKAGDEVASWFGDEDAERRRERDQHAGPHRGRGPSGYRRSDARIEEDVNDRLSDDTWLDASQIEVTVKDCEVTLDGKVDSRQAKRRAEDLCENVSGVQHCQNNLLVERPQDPAAAGAPMTATTGLYDAGGEGADSARRKRG